MDEAVKAYAQPEAGLKYRSNLLALAFTCRRLLIIGWAGARTGLGTSNNTLDIRFWIFACRPIIQHDDNGEKYYL